tara:strand:- start:1160 stop:1273 length:114 start_codon:yes stop_codon:yes gene_type:complete
LAGACGQFFWPDAFGLMGAVRQFKTILEMMKTLDLAF